MTRQVNPLSFAACNSERTDLRSLALRWNTLLRSVSASTNVASSGGRSCCEMHIAVAECQTHGQDCKRTRTIS